MISEKSNTLYITVLLFKEKKKICNKAFFCHKIIIKYNTDKDNCYLIYSKLQETTDQDIML